MLSGYSHEQLCFHEQRMRLKYENVSLRGISQTFKQQSYYKSFIGKTFKGNTLKMKSTIWIIKNKK